MLKGTLKHERVNSSFMSNQFLVAEETRKPEYPKKPTTNPSHWKLSHMPRFGYSSPAVVRDINKETMEAF